MPSEQALSREFRYFCGHESVFSCLHESEFHLADSIPQQRDIPKRSKSEYNQCTSLESTSSRENCSWMDKVGLHHIQPFRVLRLGRSLFCVEMYIISKSLYIIRCKCTVHWQCLRLKAIPTVLLCCCMKFK